MGCDWKGVLFSKCGILSKVDPPKWEPLRGEAEGTLQKTECSVQGDSTKKKDITLLQWNWLLQRRLSTKHEGDRKIP